MPKIEQLALQNTKSSVLDVGCGAGSHALYLQEQGHDVLAIDTSEGAITTCKRRGVVQARQLPFLEVEGTFDTIILLMNGTGIIGSLQEIPAFFDKLKSLLSKNGQVLIDSSDLIYLFDEDDLVQTRECIKVARKILSQNSLSKYAGKEIGPGSEAQSDEALNEYIKSKAETAYHPCGTLKMGIDDMAVVDENLKIRGLHNIRVVDASVMPEIPSANLNAPTLMIAEKASDLISNK